MNKIVKSLLYLVLLTPLVYAPQFVFPFIFPKMLWLNLTILPAFILLLINSIIKEEEIHIPLIIKILFLAQVISSLFGSDIINSLTNNYERSMGLMTTYLPVYLLVILLINTFKTKAEWLNYFKASLVVVSVVALIGLIQYHCWLGDNFLFNKSHGRIWSTLGNFTFVGTMSLWMIFISGWLYSQTKALKYVLPFALGLEMLFLSGSRSPFIGLIIGLITFIIFFSIKEKGVFRNRIIALALVLAVIVGYAFTHPSSIITKEIPGFSHLLDIKLSGTLKTRMFSWEAAWKGFKENPILGNGLNNFNITFNKYYQKKIEAIGGPYEMWHDNPHSLYFQLLSEQGLLGLVSWLMLFGSMLVLLFRRSELWLVGFVVAFSVCMSAIFFDISNLVFFFILVSFLCSIPSLKESSSS